MASAYSKCASSFILLLYISFTSGVSMHFARQSNHLTTHSLAAGILVTNDPTCFQTLSLKHLKCPHTGSNSKTVNSYVFDQSETHTWGSEAPPPSSGTRQRVSSTSAGLSSYTLLLCLAERAVRERSGQLKGGKWSEAKYKWVTFP